MTPAQIEAATEAITEAIDNSPAYDPDNASQEDSLEFLLGVKSYCESLIDALREDMEA